MKGHQICKEIEWCDMHTDKEAQKLLKKCADAETEYAWTDALKTQMRTEVSVHHLGRHSLACFLTHRNL